MGGGATSTEENSSYRVYTDMEDLRSHPGGEWTRFVCISDTHSRVPASLPDGDVLIHAGDLTAWGTPKEIYTSIDWLKSCPHRVKLVIAGNHDLILDPSVLSDFAKETESLKVFLRHQDQIDAGIYYLEHESNTIEVPNGKRWKVYGSPSSPVYRYAGSFQYDSPTSADALYQAIPEDTEILLTHTPPRGILDITRKKKAVGCEALARRMPELVACRLHVFGHIHEGHGTLVDKPGRQPRVSVNAAFPIQKRPIVVDLRN
ncbi:Metallo-dependent phosphatase [Hymenopellis radicata]|nr:Metallo-dependent phosphatase [Hymenopellis radicata]